jgi:predicted O-methyltransferase YrrM
MSDPSSIILPPKLPLIKERTRELGFDMACEDSVGALLRMLAASKKGGRLLELGTGTGVGTAWLLEGMDAASKLVTVDISAEYQTVPLEVFGGDARLEIITCDGAEFLSTQPPSSFDLVFADAFPGKFLHIDDALALVRSGGFYVVDDLLPQKNWPADHPPKVRELIDKLSRLVEFRSVSLFWSSGVMILTRI